jgi:hypothetical protein
MAETITACDVLGNVHTLSPSTEEQLVHERWSGLTSLKNARYGREYDVTVVNKELFARLCQNLKQQKRTRFYVSEIRRGEVVLQEDTHSFTVERRGEHWHCESQKCPSQNHFTCMHAKYVNAIIPAEAVLPGREGTNE